MAHAELEQARFNMIEQQVRPWEVLDPRVLEVMHSLPRENFVPERYRNSVAFADLAIPLEHDQFMLPPRIEGRMLQALQVQPQDEVLEIGTGSGYFTACLAQLGQRVLSVDLFPDFKYAAQRKLASVALDNVEFRVQDAATGWDPHARFDVIAVTGSLPVEHHGFHGSLKPGGRLFLIVGQPPVMEALLITRIAEREWTRESLFDTSVPPLLNAEPPPRFEF